MLLEREYLRFQAHFLFHHRRSHNDLPLYGLVRSRCTQSGDAKTSVPRLHSSCVLQQRNRAGVMVQCGINQFCIVEEI